MELGAARLTVQLPFSPCCHTEPCCVLSCRFSGEPTRTVSALFLLLPPPPCLALAEAAWLGDVWLKERRREENAFLLHLDPRAWPGAGEWAPPIPPPCTTQDTAPSKPSSWPRGCQASALSLTGLVLSLCSVQGFIGAPGWVILALGAPGAPGTWELGSATRFLIQHP